MNRYQKLEWLAETCGEDFLAGTFVDEVVNWMGEEDFSKFYNHLCGNHGIAKNQEELDELMKG